MGKHVAIIGLGNIGGCLAELLARLPEVERLTLVDFDTYTADDVRSQSITPRDAGWNKSRAQARRLRRIRPDLRVIPIAGRVENVPWGLLRADVICACLDNRIGRVYVNEVAWRLGRPWIDAGVAGTALLARVNVYVPGPDAPCLECAFGDRDYALLEQRYPCQGDVAATPPTNAPASLGALAASLQAIEARKLLHGWLDEAIVGKQVLIDAGRQRQYATSYRRNPECRFDHATPGIEKVSFGPARITVRRALELGRGAWPLCDLALSAPGRYFALRLTCPAGCATSIPVLRLQGRLRKAESACPSCGRPMWAGGFDRLQSLRAFDLDTATRNRSLAGLGFRPGDIFAVSGPAGERYFELVKED